MAKKAISGYDVHSELYPLSAFFFFLTWFVWTGLDISEIWFASTSTLELDFDMIFSLNFSYLGSKLFSLFFTFFFNPWGFVFFFSSN